MTIRELAVRHCVACGMFEDQAENFVTNLEGDDGLLMTSPRGLAVRNRWLDDRDNYSERQVEALKRLINRRAVSEIEKFFPDAWFKPLFDGTV